MRYQVTAENQPALADVLRLITDTRRLLAFADASASTTWDTMRSRFPSGEDIRQGFISLSSTELEDVKTQLQMFRVTVMGTPRLVAASPEVAPRSTRRSSASMAAVQPSALAS
jgi:hypothetical protein